MEVTLSRPADTGRAFVKENVANAHKAREHCRESQLWVLQQLRPSQICPLAQGLLSAQQEAQKGPRPRAKATTLQVPKPKGRTASTDLSPAAEMNWFAGFAGSLLKINVTLL